MRTTRILPSYTTRRVCHLSRCCAVTVSRLPSSAPVHFLLTVTKTLCAGKKQKFFSPVSSHIKGHKKELSLVEQLQTDLEGTEEVCVQKVRSRTFHSGSSFAPGLTGWSTASGRH
jgi:hypothetical protein